jgi:aspartate aminotransferase
MSGTAKSSTKHNISSLSTTTAQARLSNIFAHMAPANTSVFPASVVPLAPEDPLFGLMAAYRADDFKEKVDLGIGAYRDDNAKPWVLPVVKKVRRDVLSSHF